MMTPKVGEDVCQSPASPACGQAAVGVMIAASHLCPFLFSPAYNDPGTFSLHQATSPLRVTTMRTVYVLFAVLAVVVTQHSARPDEPKKGEVAILATTDSLGITVPGKGTRVLVVRSEDDMLAAADIRGNKRDKATVLGEWAKAFNVEKIDLQKQMIVTVAFASSPTPRTVPEVWQVTASDDKKLTVHWRWVSPGADDTKLGPPRLISVLVPRSDAAIELQTGPARVQKK